MCDEVIILKSTQARVSEQWVEGFVSQLAGYGHLTSLVIDSLSIK